jgi:hypothetical protein
MIGGFFDGNLMITGISGSVRLPVSGEDPSRPTDRAV